MNPGLDTAAPLEALARIVGGAHVLTDPALIAGNLEEPRGLYRGKALALVRPADTREVAAVVAYCNAARIAIVPQGGNTGLVGGQTPDASGAQVILSLQRLNRVREIDPLSETMIVEAGVTLGAGAGGRARAPTACFRSRSLPREPAPSAAISRPTPAASPSSPTATRAI